MGRAFPVVTELIRVLVGLRAIPGAGASVSAENSVCTEQAPGVCCLPGPGLPLLPTARKTNPQFPGIQGLSPRSLVALPGTFPATTQASPQLQPQADHAHTQGCRNLTAGPASGWLLCVTGLDWKFPCWSPVHPSWPSLPSLPISTQFIRHGWEGTLPPQAPCNPLNH